MKLQIFALRDSKTDQFAAPPMFLQNKGHAIRTLADEINRPDTNNILNQHPEDFELFALGEYETDTGVITPQPNPTSVVLATDLVKR